LPIKQIRLVEFDFEEERGSRLVRRLARSGSVADFTADHEALDHVALPIARLSNLVREGFHLVHGFYFDVFGRDETKFVSERRDLGGTGGGKVGHVVIETVKMQTRPVFWRRNDVLLERVVAKLR
jgi:hypothetical protein